MKVEMKAPYFTLTLCKHYLKRNVQPCTTQPSAWVNYSVALPRFLTSFQDLWFYTQCYSGNNSLLPLIVATVIVSCHHSCLHYYVNELCGEFR